MALFCYNCGVKLEADARFCAECGAKIEVNDNVHDAVQSGATSSAKCTIQGIVYTNTQRLARKFGVERSVVKGALLQYTTTLKCHGIDYTLVDAADYSFKNPKRQSEKFDSESDLFDFDTYLMLLSDAYYYGYAKFQKPQFLFIIGGADIVPMYKGANYLYTPTNGFSDSDLDSDLPYSFIVDGRSDQMMKDFDIIHSQYLLHVGRLPFGEDSSFEALTNYLNRSVSTVASRGVMVSQAYAQIDPHWLIEASEVSSILNDTELLTTNSNGQGYTQNNIHTTPNVMLANVDQHFERSADLLYFNMHGSNAPRAPFFFGNGMSAENPGGAGISPVQLSHLTRANVVVTEACYGARFDRLMTSQSMLLSALSANTLIYMGSSRIAVARTISRVEDSQYISCADVIAKLFIEDLLAGNLAGIAFSNARRRYLERLNGALSTSDKLTIAEFNLFGDPTVMVGKLNDKELAIDTTISSMPFVSGQNRAESTVECLYSALDSSSLLSMIRRAVDKNIREVRDAINQHMYDEYGVVSTSLKSIHRERAKGESSASLLFLYASQRGDVEEFYITTTSENGDIKSIVTSK